MMSDFSTATTEELRAIYEPKAAEIKAARLKLRELEADIEPIKTELVRRDEFETLILNAVMAGQQKLLRAAGTSADLIEAAEKKFKEMKEVKELARSEKVAA